MKKVSVILPIYNVSAYLRQCLDSVVNQTLRELEIICVDDGSTDNCLEIVREYAEKDDRILVLTGPNGGYGKAMNRGLDAASGEYIGIVEPDDYVAPDMFEKLYEIAAANDLDLVKADFYRFTMDKQGAEQLRYEALDKTGEHYGKLLCPARQPECIRFTMNTWTGIYRREFLNRNGIRHNETPGASFQDNGFFFQTFVHARRAMIVKEPFYRNRRDNPNSSVKSKEKVYCMNVEFDHIRDLLMADREIWERFQYMYWWLKYRNYWFTYNRIDASYREEYLSRFRREFKRAMELGQLRQTDFEDYEWKTVQGFISGANGYVSRVGNLKIVRKLSPYIPRGVKRGAVACLRGLFEMKKKIVDRLR
jgi:glycosyltransferase involved in cell wall biosynthesis